MSILTLTLEPNDLPERICLFCHETKCEWKLTLPAYLTDKGREATLGVHEMCRWTLEMSRAASEVSAATEKTIKPMHDLAAELIEANKELVKRGR